MLCSKLKIDDLLPPALGYNAESCSDAQLTQKRDSSDKNAAEDDVSMSSADALSKEALIEKKGYNMCTEILDFEVLCHAILYYVQNMAQVICTPKFQEEWIN